VRQEQLDATPLTKSADDTGHGAAARSSAHALPVSGALVAVALGIVYVVWGSTYLAIRVVVEDLPALSSAGWRFGLAGIIMLTALALRSGRQRLRVSRAELLGCALMGLLLPTLGNGLVSVAEKHGAPSGMAALIVAAVPLWIIVFRRVSGDRPGRRTTVGVLLGFAGLAGLVAASGLGGDVPLVPCLVIVVATTCWAFGSWSTSRIKLPKDAFVMTGYEMLFGGFWLLTGGLVTGEDVIPHAAPIEAWLGWAYLVVFGSLVAFTSYVWLLSTAPISLVATYAYVNPVVAVFLGWLILSEPVTLPIVLGGAVVVAAVALVVAAERPAKPAAASVTLGRDEHGALAAQPAASAAGTGQAP
jgi:drug/metabolite transporter (DMT)-like permease